jgi:hypothetical protein
MTHHFTYRVTFSGTKFYYYGIHTTKNLNDGYLGSPKTNKWCWELYEAILTPLEFFETREQAFAVEHRLIKAFIGDPLCLNAHTNASFSVQASSLGAKAQPREVKQANGRKLFEFNRAHGTGAQSLPLERKQELMRQNNARQTREQRQANAAKQHAQRWRCLVTGYETTPAPLSRYQKARGIDTSLRERVGAG